MLCVTAAAQEPGLDAATPPPAPDSVVSGTVRDALTARPIARALVAIVHAGGTIERTAITDDEGRFAFEGAPAGRFTLFATKVPDVWPRWTLGQPASAVVLPGGDRRQNVELRLQRGSAIAGTVADSYGRPLPGARVAAMRCTGLEDTCVEPSEARTATTDYQGRYRLFGLAEGTYVVMANAAYPVGVAQSPEALQWADSRLRKGGDPTAPGAAGGTARSPTYVTTYFPGVTDAAQTRAIELAAGQDVAGIDITMHASALSTISGVVLGRDRLDRLPRLSVSVSQQGRLAGSGASMSGDGTFSIPDVPPGRYRIAAIADDGFSVWTPVEVQVDGHDVSGITLSLTPGLSVSGRVVDPGPAGGDVSGIGIELRRADRAGLVRLDPAFSSAALAVAALALPLDSASVRTDHEGRFELTGLLPGQYSLTVHLPAHAQGSSVASAIVDARDVFDTPLDVRENVTGLTVTLTWDVTSLEGSIRMRDGRPGFELTIVVFPPDPALWRTGSRRVRAVPAAADGFFEVQGLPAGEYHVGAAGIGGPADIDRRLLEALAAVSPRVTLVEGETVRVDLTGGPVR
jgi:protocatechuate 3,4-dioxygenase beta subunit